MKKQPKTEFEYKLSSPVKVAKAGQEELCFILTLRAPTAKHRSHLIRIKQGLLKAIVCLQKNADPNRPEHPDDNKIPSGADLIAILYISDVDLAGLEDEFRALMLAGITSLGDGIALNVHHMDQMSLEDFEGVFGEYLVNFIMSSSM